MTGFPDCVRGISLGSLGGVSLVFAMPSLQSKKREELSSVWTTSDSTLGGGGLGTIRGTALRSADSESFWVAIVLSPQGEETELAEVKHFLHFNSSDQTLGVRLEQEGDLLIRITPVNLLHGSPLIDAEETEHRRSLLSSKQFTSELSTTGPYHNSTSRPREHAGWAGGHVEACPEPGRRGASLLRPHRERVHAHTMQYVPEPAQLAVSARHSWHPQNRQDNRPTQTCRSGLWANAAVATRKGERSRHV